MGGPPRLVVGKYSLCLCFGLYVHDDRRVVNWQVGRLSEIRCPKIVQRFEPMHPFFVANATTASDETNFKFSTTEWRTVPCAALSQTASRALQHPRASPHSTRRSSYLGLAVADAIGFAAVIL